MSIGGFILVFVVVLIILPLMLTFEWVCNIGCIVSSIFASTYLCGDIFSNATTTKDGFIILLKMTLVISTSFLFFVATIENWSGSVIDKIYESYFRYYIRLLLGTIISVFGVCFISIQANFWKYLYLVPIVFGVVGILAFINQVRNR